MDNLTAFLIGVVIGAGLVIVIKNGKEKPTNDQKKVDELSDQINKSTDELSKAVSDNTPK